MKLTIPDHHAVCFVTSSRELFLPSVLSVLKETNSYHEVTEMNVLDIDTARTLKEWNNKSFGIPKTMVVSFHTITHQAQNALLKVLEEPNSATQFILLTTHIHGLLPTVRSRLHIVEHTDKEMIEKIPSFFLRTRPDLRMELPEIETLLEAVDKEDKKDREKVMQFIGSLYEICVTKRVEVSMCKEIAACLQFASGPSSSGKMLVEYLALRLPIVL